MPCLLKPAFLISGYRWSTAFLQKFTAGISSDIVVGSAIILLNQLFVEAHHLARLPDLKEMIAYCARAHVCKISRLEDSKCGLLIDFVNKHLGGCDNG